MSAEIWLQESRTVLAQAGASVSLEFNRQNRRAITEAFCAQKLTWKNLYIDWVGGVAMAQPSFDMADTLYSAWNCTGTWETSDTYLPTPFHRPTAGGYAKALRHEANADFTATCRTEQPIGQALLIALLTYPQSKSANYLSIYFGGVWKLMLLADGNAALFQVNDAGVYTNQVAQFEWMAATDWAPATHYLMIYEVGPKLVISNPGATEDGEPKGLAYLDPTAVIDTDLETDDPLYGQLHALRKGYVEFEGYGYICIGCCNQRYLKGETSISQPDPIAVGMAGEGSQLAVKTLTYGFDLTGEVEPLVTVYDQDGNEWPQTMIPAQVNTGLAWTVAWDNTNTTAADTNTRYQTYMLAALNVIVPPLQLADGAVGTNVLAIPGVGLQSVSCSREGDQTSERFSAAFQTVYYNLAGYCKANMPVRWCEQDLNRFRGYTTNSEWTTTVDPLDSSYVIGQLTIEAEGLWSRFKRALWSGGAPLDGCKLTDVLVTLAEAAGLLPEDYEIIDDPFMIPAPPVGEAPACEYRPGTSIDKIIDDLREKFFGIWLVAYFRTSDGKFVVDYNPAYTTTSTVSAYFYQTNDAATAAGNPLQVIFSGSYQERLDQSEMANVVTVVGQDYNYQPILARCVDWGSIHTLTEDNYVGEPWHLIVIDPGIASQEAANWACRSLFDRHRNPKISAQWRSIRVDVWPGDFVQILGSHYGGIYKITGVSFEKSGQGQSAQPYGVGSYSAELVLTAAQVAAAQTATTGTATTGTAEEAATA